MLDLGDSPSQPQGGGAYQQQLALMEEQDSLLSSRAETMRTIETTIVELGTMFTQLASMVKEQDELVYRFVTSSIIKVGYKRKRNCVYFISYNVIKMGIYDLFEAFILQIRNYF